MSYRDAVENTPSIANCFQLGLRALGGNSMYVSVANTREINGSVDLDTCLRDSYPDANRWDYTFGYGGRSYYLEVHPASTNEVDTVIRKLTWLKGWLNAEGVRLQALNAPQPYNWVASGKVTIPPGSTYHRRLNAAGLTIPKTRLTIE